MNYLKFFGRANTANANTVFATTVRDESGLLPRIVNLGYVAGNTVHNVTMFKPIAKTTIAANFAANGTSLTLAANNSQLRALYRVTANSGITDIGSSTFGILKTDSGDCCLLAISAWNDTTKVATVTAGAAATPAFAATSGNTFWYCGGTADLHNANLRPPVNTRTQYNPGNHVGIFGSNYHGDPLSVYSDNGTAQGYLDVSGGYIKTAGG